MDGSINQNITESEDTKGTGSKGHPLLFVSLYVVALFVAAFFGIRFFFGGSNLRGLREGDEEQERIERGMEAVQTFKNPSFIFVFPCEKICRLYRRLSLHRAPDIGALT